jgi:hypothetical protein
VGLLLLARDAKLRRDARVLVGVLSTNHDYGIDPGDLRAHAGFALRRGRPIRLTRNRELGAVFGLGEQPIVQIAIVIEIEAEEDLRPFAAHDQLD